MKKIELTLARDYVPSWTLVDGIRELFQNAFDQEVQCEGNTASWEYSDGVLQIRNKKSVLAAKTLLLGCSSKRDDNKTIGQFGEGYKIATLVLLREGKEITIYNYGAREVWKPRFVKSRRFAADILTFFIDKEYPWTKTPTDDLVIEVSGITEDEWNNQIVPSNLSLHEYSIVESNGLGEVLDEETHAGMVYVNGLYVCKYDKYKYGYNFKPGNLKLDRDRKLASDFDLLWLASRMWADSPNALNLVEQDIADVCYLSNIPAFTAKAKNIDDAYLRFRSVYGPHAVPVSGQFEADQVPEGYKPIFVSGNYRNLIIRSSMYEEPEEDLEEEDTPIDKLEQWFKDVEDDLLSKDCNKFQEILEELKEAYL